jgi:hypothetical protein
MEAIVKVADQNAPFLDEAEAFEVLPWFIDIFSCVVHARKEVSYNLPDENLVSFKASLNIVKERVKKVVVFFQTFKSQAHFQSRSQEFIVRRFDERLMRRAFHLMHCKFNNRVIVMVFYPCILSLIVDRIDEIIQFSLMFLHHLRNRWVAFPVKHLLLNTGKVVEADNLSNHDKDLLRRVYFGNTDVTITDSG